MTAFFTIHLLYLVGLSETKKYPLGLQSLWWRM